MTSAPSKKPARARRCNYDDFDFARAAYMAGAGAGATEIGNALGVDANRAYAILQRLGISLVPKKPSEMAFPVVVSRKIMRQFEAIANARGGCPKALVAEVVNVVGSEPTLLQNLIDDLPACHDDDARERQRRKLKADVAGKVAELEAMLSKRIEEDS